MERLQTNIIGPSGPLNAKICMIGDIPGEEEDYEGEPFVGSAGQFQDRALIQVGLNHSQILFHNVFRQRPPNNDASYFYEDKSCTRYTWEGQEHVDMLRVWLTELSPKPNVLVALGRHAMYALTGKKRIWKWRGSLLPCTLVPGYKVYVTLHPSSVMRLLNEPAEKLKDRNKKERANAAFPLYISDLERIKIQGEFSELVYPKRIFDTNLSYEELVDKLKQLRKYPIIAVDIETIPKGPNGPILWMIGFAPTPEYGFQVFFLRNWKFAWSLPQEAYLLQLISEVFLDPNILKVFQWGAQYDLAVLGRYYGLRLADNTYADTCWCHHAAWPQVKKSLETLVSIYTWEPYYKDEGKVNEGRRSGDLAEANYNCKDCCVTREIWPHVEKQAKEMGVWNGYLQSMRRIPSLLDMMIRGVRTDREMKERLQVEFKSKMNFHEKRLNTRERETININSWQQIQKLLYYKHGLEPQYARGSRNTRLTTDKDALNKLKRKYPKNLALEDISEYKKYSKLYSNYAEMQLGSDNRIRTTYGFISTFRLNSFRSAFDDGGNLQNIPIRSEDGKLIRQLFMSDKSNIIYTDEEWDNISAEIIKVTQGKLIPIRGLKIMVARDLSQAEARYVVWESEDLITMEQFLDPSKDVHWERTKDLFSIPKEVEYVKKEELYVDLLEDSLSMYDLRRIGKTTKHAGNYGMGPGMLLTILAREELIFPYSVAIKLLKKTVTSDPYLMAWQASIRDELKAYRMLETPFGRRRYFLHSRMNDQLFRVGYAFRPQCTIGELLEDAIQDSYEQFTYIENLLNVHDETIFQVEPHDFVRSLRDTQQVLERPIEIKGRTLIIPCEAKAGYNWGELVEFHPQLED